MVLANGLGGTYEAFRHVYDELGERHRIVCWDYRGLYGSSPAAVAGANTVRDQVADLVEILDAEGIEQAVHIGWSMGVQVNFEYFRDHPTRVAGIVAINGTYGRPFRTVIASRFVRHVIPVALKAIRAQSELVGTAAKHVVAWDGFVDLMKRVGAVSPTLDVEAFRDVAAGFKTIDWRIYSDLIERLGEHDARDVLATVNVPTLIITGDRDVITQPFTATKMHRAIRGSKLVIIEGGTHYTPVEYPAVVKDELRAFLGRVAGYAASERILPYAQAAKG